MHVGQRQIVKNEANLVLDSLRGRSRLRVAVLIDEERLDVGRVGDRRLAAHRSGMAAARAQLAQLVRHQVGAAAAIRELARQEGVDGRDLAGVGLAGVLDAQRCEKMKKGQIKIEIEIYPYYSAPSKNQIFRFFLEFLICSSL